MGEVLNGKYIVKVVEKDERGRPQYKVRVLQIPPVFGVIVLQAVCHFARLRRSPRALRRTEGPQRRRVDLAAVVRKASEQGFRSRAVTSDLPPGIGRSNRR